MTIIAVIAAVDVGRVFAGRRNAVVTRATGSRYLCVIDHVRGRPHVAVVAVLADIGCLYMCQGLAGRFRAVVATNTVAGNVDMVEIRWSPADR